MPSTFGTDPEMVVGIIAGGYRALVRSVEGAEDDVNAGIGEMDTQRVGPNDVVMGIAASGTTPFVRAALGRAQALGARTIFFPAREPPALLKETCDICLTILVGPEVITGSTRMKAGTATKLALNTVTTGAMVRLGKAYGNLMVDLKAWNDKLTDRSERIVMETTGSDRAAARAALEAAEGGVKTAIVMVKLGVGRGEAERLIDRSYGPPARLAGRSAGHERRVSEHATLAVGLMSGTSLDGIDAALVRFRGPTHCDLLHFVTRPYAAPEQSAILEGSTGPEPRTSPSFTPS